MNEVKRRRILMIKQKGMRNWLHLPDDIMVDIFSKLDLVDILFNAQFVCSLWRKIIKDPRIFRSIRVPNSSSAYTEFTLAWKFGIGNGLSPTCGQNRITDECCLQLFNDAVQRSCGQLTEISLGEAATCNDEFLRCVTMRPNVLKSLRIATSISEITAKGLVEACRKLPLLEELEVMHSFDISPLHIVQIGQSCLQLKFFRIFGVGEYTVNSLPMAFYDDKLVFAIAQNMSQLQGVRLYITSLTNRGLQALFAGCSLLQHLDLRDCCFLDEDNSFFEGQKVLQKRCQQRVKDLILPSGSCLPKDFEYGYVKRRFHTSTSEGGMKRRSFYTPEGRVNWK